MSPVFIFLFGSPVSRVHFLLFFNQALILLYQYTYSYKSVHFLSPYFGPIYVHHVRFDFLGLLFSSLHYCPVSLCYCLISSRYCLVCSHWTIARGDWTVADSSRRKLESSLRKTKRKKTYGSKNFNISKCQAIYVKTVENFLKNI